MDKKINLELDTTKAYDAKKTFTICRGDTVYFTFTFTFIDGDAAAYMADVEYVYIYAKKIHRDGVRVEDSPLFLREIHTAGEKEVVTCLIEKEETAGEGGQYLLAVILQDSYGRTITAQTIPFTLFNQGYAGVQETPKDFRDDILDAADKVTATADALTKGVFIFDVGGGQKVKATVAIENNIPYWNMEVIS